MAITNLVTTSTISVNLKRTATKGLISLLNQKQLEELAIKYYGVYENGKLKGYICPYSGELITNTKDIVLEHIIPVSSTGGTVLFNCIPTSTKVNGSDEKGALHLLEWWKDKSYYSGDKLNRLMAYMFEAYDKVFSEYTIEEVENSYLEIEEIEEEADLTTTQEKEAKKLREQASKTGIISYLGFINDCITELKNNNYDTTYYELKLKEYEERKIFKQIERFTLIQNILKRIIKDKIQEEDRSELTYMLNIDINKLMTSIDENLKEEEIYNVVLKRINDIEDILNKNNIGIMSFFEDIKRSDVLYKEVSLLTEEEINQFVSDLNLCVRDKFNKMIEFTIENEGRLPSTHSKEEREKQLGRFRSSIQSVLKGSKNFSTQLKKEELEYLHNSENENLKEIYKVILNRAIEKNIEIPYVDEYMKSKIEEFNILYNKAESIEEKIELERTYKDYIVIDSQFNEMIAFTFEKNGKLPREDGKDSDEREKQLGRFRRRIQTVPKGSKNFSTQLKKEELEYLHNSENENLKEIYKVILNKAIENNIEIPYVDEYMKSKIEEFNILYNQAESIEEKIELERTYKDYIIIDSQFNEMIAFTIENNGKLPREKGKDSDEREKQLGRFRRRIQRVPKGRKNFHTSLTKEELEYLHNSENENLKEIYKVILNRAIEKNIEIPYVDEYMKSKIEEFNILYNQAESIEEKIELERTYKDYIIIDSQFNEMIAFTIENNGKLPRNNGKDSDEREKQLGNFRNSIQQVPKGSKNFNTQLTKEELEYLHNSENENLKEIYKVILNKAIENNIEIPYVDEYMKSKIEEFNILYNQAESIEEKIELERTYKDYIIIDSQFNEMIAFTIENNGKLPRTDGKDRDEREKQLGTFRISIQRVPKGSKNFSTQLTKEELEYLHNSEYENLRMLYESIMKKAYDNNIIEYIQINEEIENRNKKGRVA